jgi:hypothetical protein
VSWTAPSDGGSPITSYTVTASPGGATSTVDGGTTSATVTALNNGTSYTFTVAATNVVGTGPASAASNAVTPTAPATAPGAPTGVNATAGDAQATVSWTAPSDGGSPITSYTVTASPGGTMSTVDGSTSSATVTGLTNGTSYTFTVTATNAVGPGPASAASNTVTPSAPPAAPVLMQTTIGQASAVPSGGLVRVALPGAVTAGDRLVVCVVTSSRMVLPVSRIDNDGGNTFTRLVNQTGTDLLTTQSVWTATDPAGGATSVQVTLGSPTAPPPAGHGKLTAKVVVTVLEYAGLSPADGTAAVDQQATATGHTAAAATVDTGATGATTAGGELAIAFFASAPAANVTVTAGSGWSTRINDTPTTGLPLVASDQTVPLGGTSDATFSPSGAVTWLAADVVFRLNA